MRRIILVVGLALLMATFVVLSALPAFARVESIFFECTDSNGAVIFRGHTGEVPRNDLGFYRQLCKDSGGTLTMTVEPEAGPPSDRPPCCVPS
jgi:hypothetical protein